MEWIQAAFRLSLIGIGILILSVIYIALMIRLYRFLQVKVERDHKIKISNQGNVRSIYQLTVESPEPRLRFKLSSKGMPLIEIPEAAIPEVYTAPTDPINHQSGSGKGSAIKSSNLDTAKAAATGREIAGKAGVVASFLGTLGNLIPGSLGNQIRSKGASVRGVQTRTLQTTQEPIRTQQKVAALKKNSGRLTGGRSDKGDPTNENRISAGDQQEAAVTSWQPETSTTRNGQPSSNYRVQTNEVGPGESLSLSLHIDSKKWRNPGGSYLYTIHSQQVSLAPTDIEIPPVTSRGTVHFKSVTAWRYWLPITICGLLVVMTFLSLFYYLTNI